MNKLTITIEDLFKLYKPKESPFRQDGPIQNTIMATPEEITSVINFIGNGQSIQYVWTLMSDTDGAFFANGYIGPDKPCVVGYLVCSQPWQQGTTITTPRQRGEELLQWPTNCEQQWAKIERIYERMINGLELRQDETARIEGQKLKFIKNGNTLAEIWYSGTILHIRHRTIPWLDKDVKVTNNNHAWEMINEIIETAEDAEL